MVRGAQHKGAKPFQPVQQTESLHLSGHRLISIAAAREIPLAGHPARAQATLCMMRSSSDMVRKGSEMACQATLPRKPFLESWRLRVEYS